jgi:hypothetical protein
MKRYGGRLATAGIAMAALAMAAVAQAAESDPFGEVLQASLAERKGVMIYANGQAIPGRVTKLGPETVELSSQEFRRIVVRRDRIDAVAGN